MPSPFPGMDPYLEDPYLWPDFHNALAAQMRDVLNRHLPEHYFAQLEMREEMGIVGDYVRRIIVPDVGVGRGWGGGPQQNDGGVAVLDAPRTGISPSRTMCVESDATQLASIEIRDIRHGRELVSLIEIISPTNKQPGEDRTKYMLKRQRILASKTSLVEIDLLRSGETVCIDPELISYLWKETVPSEYIAVVNRAWERQAGVCGPFQFFPIRIAEQLPVIPIPLRQGEDESPLDLQHLFRLTYDGGPYRRGAVDYSQPPIPPLADYLHPWAAEVTRRFTSGAGL